MVSTVFQALPDGKVRLRFRTADGVVLLIMFLLNWWNWMCLALSPELL